MYIILGGTGHVGSVAADTLLARGEQVTVVSHRDAAREEWEAKGANFAVADVDDSAALRKLFREGRRLFLLNPPAAPDTDTDAIEKKHLHSILAAIDGSGLEKIVAESTYGAQDIERAGDLGILYDMEQALDAQSIPHSVIRAAYYMSNWDAAYDSARERGTVQSFYPAGFQLPMVAPRDLGRIAADLLMQPVDQSATHFVEGPSRYSPADVAACFAGALGREVAVEVVPRERWVSAFRELGFSEPGAQAYAAMTAATADEDPDQRPRDPLRGEISLRGYIDNLVARKQTAR